jgi:vacuolar-type H+-ATPase subunit F/Vma7
MSYYVIADEDTVLGFRYAGVPGEVAENPEQALEAFQRAASSRPGDVLILTEDLAAGIRAAVNHVRFDLQTPVVVEVPGARGPAPGRPDLLKLIQEAIGVKLTT